MIKSSNRFYLLPLLLLLSTNLFAQDDLNIFGFYQVRLQKTEGSYNVNGNVPTPAGPMNMVFDSGEEDFTSPAVQQLNVFLRKELTNSLTSFVNIEIGNNFSTQNDWGYFNLEEAWLNYQYSNALNIKAGILIPKFNYLNEVKNRMPLLPYVIRPLVYESSLASTIEPESYLPERAFVQVHGILPASNFIFDYAVYVGPGEKDYVATKTGDAAVQAGIDTTNNLLIGGRFGANFYNVRLGASFTTDKKKQLEYYGTPIDNDASRTRIGFDVGYNYEGIFLEGEYINVNLDTDKTNEDLNRTFYYAMLGYNFSEEFYGYGLYSKIINKQSQVQTDGISSYGFGVGYKPVYSVVVKLEYGNYFISDGATLQIPIDPSLPPITANAELDYKTVNLAISVIF
jgi:hypothetical protein